MLRTPSLFETKILCQTDLNLFRSTPKQLFPHVGCCMPFSCPCEISLMTKLQAITSNFHFPPFSASLGSPWINRYCRYWDAHSCLREIYDRCCWTTYEAHHHLRSHHRKIQTDHWVCQGPSSLHHACCHYHCLKVMKNPHSPSSWNLWTSCSQ